MNEVTRRVSGEKAAFSVNDFCHRYSIGRTSFYAEVAAGRLVARKLGKKTIVLAQDAETWSRALPSVSERASA